MRNLCSALGFALLFNLQPLWANETTEPRCNADIFVISGNAKWPDTTSRQNENTEVAQPSNWERYMQEGVDAADRRDFLNSAKGFQSALNEAVKQENISRTEKSLDNLGWAFMQLHSYSEAVGAYRRLHDLGKIYPISVLNYSSSLNNYCYALRQDGLTADAEEIESEIPLDEYMRVTSRQLQKSCRVGCNLQNYRATINFEIESDGKISHLKIGKGSGSADFDKFALQAVKQAGPFPPLPSGAPRPVRCVVTVPDRTIRQGD